MDRRWSIGLSLPFTLQDADIDPERLQDVRPFLSLKPKHNMLTADLGQRLWLFEVYGPVR
jgi:hypothetical protein